MMTNKTRKEKKIEKEAENIVDKDEYNGRGKET